jgi:hypothetical protein
LFGRFDDLRAITGHNLTFVYDDFKYVLKGTWIKGQMKEAKEAKIVAYRYFLLQRVMKQNIVEKGSIIKYLIEINSFLYCLNLFPRKRNIWDLCKKSF